jgi:hypothetical protein
MNKFFQPINVHENPVAFFAHIALSLGAVFGILALLHAAPKQYRKSIIAVFTFLGGLYYVAEFFLPAKNGNNRLTPYNDLVANIFTVVGAYAIGLGVISLLQMHVRKVVRTTPGWTNSAALVISFFAMTIFGLLNAYAPKSVVLHAASVHITNADVFKFLFTGGIGNFGSAIFSMIAFFIASAAYRAFRIRSLESSLLMTAALIIMLGSVGFGTILTNWLPLGDNPKTEFWANFRIENISQWLLLQVNTPAQRGILFGITLGELAMALRLWLSLERGSYFDKEV